MTERGRWRGRVAASLAAAAALLTAWAAVVFLSGGFVLGAGLSSKDPWRPLGVAFVLFALALVADAGRARHVIRAAAGRGIAAPRRAALAAACALFVAAVAWNTRAAGGSDSSCYILQADAFLHGHAALRAPLAREIPLERPDGFFAPTGFLASPIERGAAVPICGPGLALAMTAAAAIGGTRGVMLVVPAFAALLAWAAFALGRRLDDEWCGAAAAILVAASPIVLYQSVQPMSDVPAAALWIAATAAAARRDRRGAVGAGLLGSAAVLVRPNLALPLPAVACVLIVPPGSWRTRVRLLMVFAAAAVPCLLTLGWLNALRYGSPLVSGYGSTAALFALAHVGPNARRYSTWLMTTETPFVLLSIAAPWWALRRHRAREAWIAALVLIAAALVSATYLAYTVFDEWWYLRFLLPGLAPALVLATMVALGVGGGDRPRARAVIAVGACLMLGVLYVHVAGERRVFELRALESRFVLTGEYAARALPSGAVVLAVQQSGAIRYHGRRLTGMWDQLDPSELDRAVRWLESRGRPVFIALEDGEQPRFRARFAGQQFGQLDWPPRAEIHAAVRVFVYAVSDRAAYRAGAPLRPEHIR